jgi:hypothetical protein
LTRKIGNNKKAVIIAQKLREIQLMTLSLLMAFCLRWFEGLAGNP